MKVERADGRLVRENQRLRNALEALLEEMESSGATDTARVRESLGQPDGISPPWERDGFDNKTDWLENKRGNNQNDE